MNIVSTAVSVALGAVEVGIDLYRQQITAADAGVKLVQLAVETGAELDQLHQALTAAGVARQKLAFQAAKLAELGDPGDEG